MIRRAHVADVPEMARIINDCAEFGLMLPRSQESLFEKVRDFQVAIEGHRIVGVCGLSIVWANLAEIASLAVEPGARGKGFGRQLAEACLDDARQLGVKRIMTLTYERGFFEKLGFCVVDRQQLPLKVWRECVRCPKNQACDEIAMILELPDVSEVAGPQPRPRVEDEQAVPITLSARRNRTAPVDDD